MHRNGSPNRHRMMRISIAALTALLCCSTFAASMSRTPKAALDFVLEDRAPGTARLGELLLEETVDLAAIDAPSFAALIRQRRAEEYDLPETVVILGASKRMASARRDLWEALEWLRRREAATVRPHEP